VCVCGVCVRAFDVLNNKTNLCGLCQKTLCFDETRDIHNYVTKCSYENKSN